MNTKVVRNGEMKLTLKGILKRANGCENLDKIRPKKLQREHEIAIQILDETENRLWELIRGIKMHLFRVQLISNRRTVL